MRSGWPEKSWPEKSNALRSRNASQGYSSTPAYNGQQNYRNQGNYGNSAQRNTNQQGNGQSGTYSDPRAYQNQSVPSAPGPMPPAPALTPSTGAQNGGFTPNTRHSNSTGTSAPGYHQDPIFGEGFMNIPDGIEEELPFN